MNEKWAIEYIRHVSFIVGTIGAEQLSDKDGQKMRECLDFLTKEIDNLQNVIDYKLGMWTRDNKYGLSLISLLKALEKAEKYDDVKEWLQVEIEISNQRKPEYGNCFDGVAVTNKNRVMLLEKHIKFCENILKQMELPANKWS